MSFKTQNDVQREAENARYNAAAQNMLKDVYVAFPRLTRNMAFDKMIIETIQNFAGTDVLPTLALFKSAVDANPEILEMGGAIPQVPERERKGKLIAEILIMLRDHGTGYNLDKEAKRLAYLSINDLEARKTELAEKQRLAKLSPTEIRAGIAANRAANAPARPVLPADVTIATIKRAAPSQIRAWIRAFGADAVNDRLFGRS